MHTLHGRRWTVRWLRFLEISRKHQGLIDFGQSEDFVAFTNLEPLLDADTSFVSFISRHSLKKAIRSLSFHVLYSSPFTQWSVNAAIHYQAKEVNWFVRYSCVGEVPFSVH